MFAKLLKHEWRATKGIIGLLCVVILISGLTIGGVMHYMLRSEIQQADNIAVDGFGIVVESEESTMSDLTVVLCVLLLTAGVLAIAVCSAGSLFFLIYRFYKRCFTDEGYLTFTLPVNNHQILLSSLVNCILSELVVMLAAIAAVAFAVILLLTAFPQNIAWAALWSNGREMLVQLWDSFVKNADQFALVGFSAVLGVLSELIVLMLAVTIGALIAKKHKILAAVGVYYGIGLVQSFMYTMFALGATSQQNVNTLLATPGLMGAVLAVGGYFGMHYLISRKLNLT